MRLFPARTLFRKPLALVVGALVVASLTAAGIAMANHTGVIRAEGTAYFEANALFGSTFRFEPDIIHVRRGDAVTLRDSDEASPPHTLTIVRRSELPTNPAEATPSLAGCEICQRTVDRHFRTDPPDRVLEDDRDREFGLDGRGDSILIFDGESINRRVTAPRGSRLFFLCAIHPWMQGRIDVI
jgi:plastocyanin